MRIAGCGLSVGLITAQDLAFGVEPERDAARTPIVDLRAGQLAKTIIDEPGIIGRRLGGIGLVRDLRLHRAIPPGVAVRGQRIGGLAVIIVLVVDGRDAERAAQRIRAARPIIIARHRAVADPVALARRAVIDNELAFWRTAVLGELGCDGRVVVIGVLSKLSP